MSTSKRIDRKSFLTSSFAACAAVTLGACSGETDTRDPDEPGAGTGGAGTGGTSTGGTSTGGTSTGGTGGMGASTGGNAMGGAGTAGTSGGGTGGMAATSGGGTAGNAMGGAGTAGTSDGGTGGNSGGGGGTLTCTTETDNGNHAHNLVVPPSDVERGYQDKGVPYVLEDGGTGHMHTLMLTDYEFLYLQADGTFTKASSMEAGHSHQCVITCVEE
jgi:hypothetical protein